MELLKQYFELQQKIFEYFGYVEDWVVIPLEDCTDYYWYLTGEDHNDEVHFAETEKELIEQDGKYYVNEIYMQRFLPKWVYRGEDYTMVSVDTHTDGNHFLQVFSNSRERPNTGLHPTTDQS